MIRVLALVGGLGGAVTLSQFPEYSQQYLQRLAGAVDELTAVVAAFDASAEGFGLSRDAALENMGGTAFQNQLRADMEGNIARLERLSADYAALSGTAPLERLTMAWRLKDADLVARTWEDFQPAVPLTQAGAVSAGIGFGAGWLMLFAVVSLLSWPFRHGFRHGKEHSAPRKEPILRRDMEKLADYGKTESQRSGMHHTPEKMFEM